jgi:hypothetical protein
LDFWFENKPSGNPGCDQQRRKFVETELDGLEWHRGKKLRQKFLSLIKAVLRLSKEFISVSTIQDTTFLSKD